MVTAELNPLPNCLRRWRKRNRTSQARLAADLGVTPSIVSQWEQHRCLPTLKKFSALSQHTGIPVRTLLRFFLCEPTEDDGVVQFHAHPKPLIRSDSSN